MSNLRWAFFALFMGISVVDCVCAERNRLRILKPFIMPVLAVFYFLSASSPSVWIIIALLLDAVGDYFLIGNDARKTVIGMVFFGLGHCAYIAEFVHHIQPSSGGLILLARLFYIGMVLVQPYLLRKEKKLLRTAGSIYGIFLAAMSYMACRLACSLNSYYACMVWVGSLIFILSDSLISNRLWKCGKETGIMETYLLGQALIIFGLLGMRI